LQEGSPGNERLVVPAACITLPRAVTVAVAVIAGLADGWVLYRILTVPAAPGAWTVGHLLAALTLTFLAALFGSESMRILLGRESLSLEDVFVVHEMALPFSTTTRTKSLSRIESLHVLRYHSAHPGDLPRQGKWHLAMQTRDGTLRLGFGLSREDLDRFRTLAERNLTAARIRIGIREGRA